MEELKMDQKEVFRTFCLGYSQILQSFGGSMNFAVERSFYERFYLALGYFFKAHIPPADWPCVSSHLSYVLHADLDASMNSVTGPFKKKKKWKDQRTSSYHGNGQLGGPRRKSSMKSNPCQAFDLFNEQGTPSVSSLRPPPHQKDTHPLFNPNSVHHSTVAAVAAAGMAHLKSSPSILKKKSSGPSTSYYHGGKEKRVSLVSSNLDLQVDPPLQNESKTSTSEQPTPVLPTDKNKHFSKLRYI
ncbi:hypothetical protein HMI55_004100 [Coelomomyces lativittatus]|nr:hypothetical protein HMI55_004100 [Coelomomyces lativittatus]